MMGLKAADAIRISLPLESRQESPLVTNPVSPEGLSVYAGGGLRLTSTKGIELLERLNNDVDFGNRSANPVRISGYQKKALHFV